MTSVTDLDGVFEATDFAKTTNQTLNVEGTSNRLLGLVQTVITTNNNTTRSVVTTPVSYTVDANGAMTSDGLRTFDYDASNRMSKVKVYKDGEAASISYLHNASGSECSRASPQPSRRCQTRPPRIIHSLEQRKKMNTLVLSGKYLDDHTMELFAVLRYDEFSGAGSCFLDSKALLNRAERFSLFPLPADGSVCIEGGYFCENMKDLAQTHLHISARPSDALGKLKLSIVLAVPVDIGIQGYEANLACAISVTYEQLKKLSDALISIANGNVENLQIDL